MNKRVIRIVGMVLLFSGFFSLMSSVSITGYAVFGEEGKQIRSVLGIILIVIGIVLIMVGRGEEGGLEKHARKIQKIKRQIDQELRSGKVGSYRDLKKYATKLGYEIKEGGEHILVYQEDRKITEIPRAAHGEATGTYRKILRELYDAAA